MSEKLNYLLIKAYHQWKCQPSPPVPLKIIREYLKLEGIDVDGDGYKKLKKR